MEPNLLVGDRLFVTKFTYGYSKHSFPFSPPFFENRIFTDNPERGDVATSPLSGLSVKMRFSKKGGLNGKECLL